MMRSLLILFVLLIPITSLGEIVQLNTRQNLVATADFRPGNSKKPLIIVLHGLLQTYQFQATKNIIDGLAANGYPVLGPNLTLGVSLRKKSLECEAVHTHTLQEDLNEIGKWIKWGKSKNYNQFVLVGHSWGSHHILALMESTNANLKGLQGTILVSLTPTGNTKLARQIRFAKTKTKAKRNLAKYNFSFCKEYTSTPESFISYAQWSNKRILSSLHLLKSKKLPTSVVLGSNDKRLTKDWLKHLKSTQIRVDTIKGANHFFSSVYEFDLIDKITLILLEMKN